MNVYRASNTAPHSLEGQLYINLDMASGGVQIHSDRALQAHRILIGKTPDEALQLVPRLFGICANSHTLACHLALRHAGSNHPQPPRASTVLVQLEVLREDLMRLLRSLPTDTAGPAKPGKTASTDKAVNPQLDLSQAIQACVTLSAALSATIQTHNVADIEQKALAVQHCVFERVVQLPAMLSALISGDQQRHTQGANCTDNSADSDTRDTSGTSKQTIGETPAAPGHWQQDWQNWLDQADSPAARMIQHFSRADLADLGSAGDTWQALPSFEPGQIAAVLQADDATQFVARPTWAGQPHETGTLARLFQHPVLQAYRQRYGTGLLTRSVATVLELVLIGNAIGNALNTRSNTTNSTELGEPSVAGSFYQGCGDHEWAIQAAFVGASTAEQTGCAIVEAARGRLVHFAQLDKGVISDYRILAPTEWNCHPQGPLWQALRTTMHQTQCAKPERQQDELAAQQHAACQSNGYQRLIAEHLIQAIDPCVGYQLQIISGAGDQLASDGETISGQSSTNIGDDPDYA